MSWMTSLNHSQNQFRPGGRGHSKKRQTLLRSGVGSWSRRRSGSERSWRRRSVSSKKRRLLFSKGLSLMKERKNTKTQPSRDRNESRSRNARRKSSKSRRNS